MSDFEKGGVPKKVDTNLPQADGELDARRLSDGVSGTEFFALVKARDFSEIANHWVTLHLAGESFVIEGRITRQTDITDGPHAGGVDLHIEADVMPHTHGGTAGVGEAQSRGSYDVTIVPPGDSGYYFFTRGEKSDEMQQAHEFSIAMVRVTQQ